VARTSIIKPWEVDLDLIEPHPFWQLEQGGPFHHDLTFGKKTICKWFFWKGLYHGMSISCIKRVLSPQSGHEPLSCRNFGNCSVDELVPLSSFNQLSYC
jgi:hypothetical protein